MNQGAPHNTKEMDPGSIRNFRRAAGIENVFRCGSTDELGVKIEDNCQQWSNAEWFVLQQAGMILDLRSPGERNEPQARKWMEYAPRPIQVVAGDEEYRHHANTPKNRFVVRINVLSPPRFMSYIEDNWLRVSEKVQATWFRMIDGQKLHELRIEALNERGLAGLNEIILETGKRQLCRALQTITLHLEKNPSDPVVIHCVQGKDR